MKKILFILLLFSGFVASAQPGYTNINARYGWEAGLFKGFRGPAGDSAQFRAGQAQHAGSQYWDSTDNNTPSGLYIWDGAVWELQSSPVQFCNQFTVLISITYISGFDFAASEGSYNINCVPYNSDSATFRLDTADDDFDRYDVFYADETGVHVLKGVAEELATIPSLEAGQLFIAWVRIPANAITPAISYADIYKENIEWTGSVGSGATANFDNGSNVYMGSKSVYWSAVGNLDNLLFTNGSTVDLGDYDAISIFIRNTQVVAPSANLFLRWENDNAVVSNEVLVRMNKATVGSYQAISIPLSLFTIQNYNANKLRIIYRHSNVAINSGFYIDNIFLESGLVLPGGPGNDVTIVSNIPAITVQESNDNFTLSANGNSSQYIDGTGALRTFNAVTAVGVVNSETKSTNGAVVDGANLILQDVDASFRGLVTPTMKLSWDSVYTVEELSSLGYPIMIPIDEARTGFKRIVFDDEWKNTDSTIHLDTTAAGAAQLFGKIGGDVAAAENRDFATGANQFRLHSNDGSVSTFLDFWDVGNLKIGSDNVGSEGSGGHFNFGSGIITVNNLTASSVSSLKMLAIDTAGGSNILYTTAIPAGGATPNLQEVTDIGNATTTDLTVKNTGGGSLVTLFNFDNAGAISFRATDSSDYSHLRQAGPLTAPQYTFLPVGSGNDTLATLADVRAGGGGSDGNFAENDLTFDGNRAHALAGNTLSISGGDFSLLGEGIDKAGVGYAVGDLPNYKFSIKEGIEQGAELVTNGSFTGGSTGWTLGTGWAYGSNQVTFTPPGGAVDFTNTLRQSFSLTQGLTYIVTATVGGTTGLVDIEVGDFFDVTGESFAAGSGVITSIQTVTGDSDFGVLFFPSDDFDGTIDNVSVKLYTLTPAFNVVGNSTLTGDLNVTGNAGFGVAATMPMQVQYGGNDLLKVDVSPSGQESLLAAVNATDDDNIARVLFITDNTEAVASFQSVFNGGSKVAMIVATSNTSSGIIEHTADIHNITGAVNITGATTLTGDLLTSTDNTYDIGSAAASFKDGYFRTTKYDGATSGTITVEATATAGTNTITLPAATGTVALTSNMSITKGFMTDTETINGVSTIVPRHWWYDEFQGASTGTAGTTYMVELVTGTGANASAVANASTISGATGYGYAELNTGTTTTGKAVLSGGVGLTNQNQMGLIDNDYYYRSEYKVILNDLSDGTETYKVTFGFFQDNTASNSVVFTYTHSENSGVWNCTSHNMATPETTSTATTVAADTQYKLGIEIYNQTVKFYLDGTLVATHTTQVPAAASVIYAPSGKILKSAGTTARIAYMDAAGLRITHENEL